MSTYEYFEFVAVERALSPAERAELRRASSRATITPTRFVNEYHYGNFKGDAREWMRRLFDAHVHSASWASCALTLRVPRAALPDDVLAPFLPASEHLVETGWWSAFEVESTERHRVLDWRFADVFETGDIERFNVDEDGPGWMGRLLPLREELLRGDLRPLYLGWLALLDRGELEGDAPEPSPPAGLRELSPAQEALAEFLLLDPDRIAVAAASSPPLPGSRASADASADAPVDQSVELDAWIAGLDDRALRAMARLIAEGRGHEAERELRRDWSAWQAAHGGADGPPTPRTAAGIEAGVDGAREVRAERERLERERAEAALDAERAKRLEKVARMADATWATIDRELGAGVASAYDRALGLTAELAEALRREGRAAEFDAPFARVLEKHGRRRAFVRRLKEAGLLPD